MIGINTVYRTHDATIVATTLARKLKEAGKRFSIHTNDWRSQEVDHAFDQGVHTGKFKAWLKNLSHIVWTEPAPDYLLYYSIQAKIKNSLYTSWDQLEQYDVETVQGYNYILLPTSEQAINLRERFEIKHAASLPYDPYLPITKKYTNNECDKLKLFICLYGSQLRRLDLASVLMLAEILEKYDHVHVTIAAANGVSTRVLKILNSLKEMFDERWQVLVHKTWSEVTMMIGNHDLTIWPTGFDGIGIVGLTSLYMGTPVVAWNAAPMNEYLIEGRNSVLVKCETETNWLGMPIVKPDTDEFVKTLSWLIEHPESIAELRKHTYEKLFERRKEANKGWNIILPAM